MASQTKPEYITVKINKVGYISDVIYCVQPLNIVNV